MERYGNKKNNEFVAADGYTKRHADKDAMKQDAHLEEKNMHDLLFTDLLWGESRYRCRGRLRGQFNTALRLRGAVGAWASQSTSVAVGAITRRAAANIQIGRASCRERVSQLV